MSAEARRLEKSAKQITTSRDWNLGRGSLRESTILVEQLSGVVNTSTMSDELSTAVRWLVEAEYGKPSSTQRAREGDDKRSYRKYAMSGARPQKVYAAKQEALQEKTGH